MELTIGIEGYQELMTEPSMSAAAVGSGALDVFATPSMISLMEKTALYSVAPYLEEGMSTVGTALNVTHDAATPIGMKVWCKSVLTEIGSNGRELTFTVEAFDAAGKIGGGIHKRFIVNGEKFVSRVNKKIEQYL